MKRLSVFYIFILFIFLPSTLLALSLASNGSTSKSQESCTPEVRISENGEKIILPCNSHQPCSYIVLLHNNEGYTQWEVPESEFQEGDQYICVPAAGIGCDSASGCECVPYGRNFNNGDPTRFCRCLKKEKSQADS
jgi:hypothetical protein